MTKNQAKLLLQKYISGNCNEQEKALLESWYLNEDLEAVPDLSEADREKDLTEVLARLEAEYDKPKQAIIWPIISAAAMVLLAISAGLYFYMGKPGLSSGKKVITREYANNIKPGSNKAILILADGKQISLDAANIGELATQAGVEISKTADGEIIYTVVDFKLGNKSGFNTIQTPRGGQYQVRLPDGTKVWLNAASSIRYPAQFELTKREVELSGEAYFEVAKDKNRPFKVISENQIIEVLGTHFNVNSYKDESSIKTTLLEGQVKVLSTKTGKDLLLKPGKQSELISQNFKVTDADVEEVMSWKNGQFMFVNESLGSIMRKLARWYDVEINYHGDIAERTYSGSISKYEDVAEVLKTLELTKSVKFKIQGNTIIAMNYK